MIIPTTRRRKSEPLTKVEHTSLRKYIGSHLTVSDAADALGINRSTLERVALIGKGSPETINAIREKLNQLERA